MSNTRTTTSQISERMRVAREMAGLTQAQVAKILGLHRPSISEIEAGRRKISADELSKLAELYGVSVDWITSTMDQTKEIDNIRLELAARELSKLKPEDLDRVLNLLLALRH
jgi:transcriptional regulator with XRE-family HTH domain